MNEEIPFLKGEYYWLEDSQESYLAGVLLNPQPTQNNDYQFEIFQTGRVVWTNRSQINGIIPSPGDVTLKTLYDDLTDSVDISEASVLWNLRQRYQIHNIYSGMFIHLLFSPPASPPTLPPHAHALPSPPPPSPPLLLTIPSSNWSYLNCNQSLLLSQRSLFTREIRILFKQLFNHR
jgi:hypothetical protein